MPDNWIGHIKLTNETELLGGDGTKLHDYLPCNQGAGVPVDKALHPVLWGKLGGTDGDELSEYVRWYYRFNLPDWTSAEIGTHLIVVGDVSAISGAAGRFYEGILPQVTSGGGQLHLSKALYWQTGVCTLEFQCNTTNASASGSRIILGRHRNISGADTRETWSIRYNGTHIMLYYKQSVILSAPTATDWFHVAIIRTEDNSLYMCINGVVAASVPQSPQNLEQDALSNPDQQVRLGDQQYRGSTGLLLDELRYTEGVQRYDLSGFLPQETEHDGAPSGAEVPSISEPTNSPAPYKIVADKT